MSLQIQRQHIEETILCAFLYQNISLPMDEIELKDTKIPFKLFKANRTIRMVAKAIHILQEEKTPIDEVNVMCYIEKHTTINSEEMLSLLKHSIVSYDSMTYYLNQLIEIDREEEKIKILQGV